METDYNLFMLEKISEKEFLQYLDTFLNFEKLPQKNIFWLDTIEFLCKKLGNPEKFAPCFHVAGSKGKGSVTSLIASIMQKAGYKMGLYASPHILDFTERVREGANFFSRDVYEKSALELVNTMNNIPLSDFPSERPVTWFELVTLFGFLCLRNANVNCAVYEVGLGGRLDATNVVNPKISVINTIELEHTEFLGDTVEKIAAEKAGIIKTNTPCVIAEQSESVRKVFEEIAESRNSKCYFINDLVKNISHKYVKSKTGEYLMETSFESSIFTRPIKANMKLLGKFQADNAALASCAVKLAYPEITEDIIEEGLKDVTLQARFEIIHNPKKYNGLNNLVIDGAHTVNSVHYTMETFDAFYKDKANLLFACAADKDVEDIAKYFKNRFRKVVLTRPGNIKSSSPEKMIKAFQDSKIDFVYEENYSKAIKDSLLQSEKTNSTLLVIGSFYLAAEVKKELM